MSQSSCNIRVGDQYANREGSAVATVTTLLDSEHRPIQVRWVFKYNDSFADWWYTEEEIEVAIKAGYMVPYEPEFL